MLHTTECEQQTVDEPKKKAVVVAFGSGAAKPLSLLSNFAFCENGVTITWAAPPQDQDTQNHMSTIMMMMRVPAFLHGVTATYDTSEHAFQALCARTLKSARKFETGRKVARMDLFRAFPVPKKQKQRAYALKDMYDQKMAYWGRRGMPGILAKMVANLPAWIAKDALGLRLRSGGGANANVVPFKAQWAIWGQILLAKFSQNPRHLAALLGTPPGSVLVERGRFRNAAQYWTAYLDRANDDALVGQNMMGRLLRRARRHLRRNLSE